MHLGNTLAFCVLGLGMIFLPALVPDFFPPAAATGYNLSGLWLRCMGWVNGLVGCGLLLTHHVLPRVVQMMAWRPELPEMRPTEILRPAIKIYEDLEAGEREGGQQSAA